MLPSLVFLCFILRNDPLSWSSRPSASRRTAIAVLSEETSQIDFPSAVSDEERVAIQDQLGYIPTNLVKVSATRGTGSPLALKTYSLNGGASRRKAKAVGVLTPFPTLYWFCCPIVGKAVADLERQGYVGILEQKLMEEPRALDNFIQSHKGYARERWAGLTAEHQRHILQNERMTQMVRYSGVAGTDFKSFAPRDSDEGELFVPAKASIKCLHAHYAHYRSQLVNEDCDYPINIVGKWIDEILKEKNCELVL